MKTMTIDIEVPDNVSGFAITDAIRAAQRVASGEYITIWWHFSDVQERAKEIDIELTDDEAIEVLWLMDKYHDCNLGISWDVMDVHIDNVLADREIQELQD